MEVVVGIMRFSKCERLLWSLGFLPQMGNNSANGRYGEWVGEKFLKRRGFSVMHRNWRSVRDRRLEIDLVCMDVEVLVFVEIRARSENSLVDGYSSLNRKKRNALARSIRSFLREESLKAKTYRLDLLEIDLPRTTLPKPQVLHHENIAISF